MKKINLTIVLLFVLISVHAQFRIEGQLIQPTDSLPIEYAVLQAYTKSDSLLAATTSNSQGVIVFLQA